MQQTGLLSLTWIRVSCTQRFIPLLSLLPLPTATSLCTTQGGQRGTLIWEHKILFHTPLEEVGKGNVHSTLHKPQITVFQGCTAFGRWQVADYVGMMGAAGRVPGNADINCRTWKEVSYPCLPMSWKCRMWEMGSAWWVLSVLSPQCRV